MIKSFSVSTLIFLATALIEAAIFSNLTFLPANPDLSLICLLYLSINNGRLYGECAGFVSGFFLDLLSMGPFGLNTLLRTVLGYFAGLFNKVINTESIFIQFLLGFIATLTKAFVLFILSFLYPNSVISYNPLSWLFVFELAVNTLLTPLIFLFLNLFRKVLLLKPETVI